MQSNGWLRWPAGLNPRTGPLNRVLGAPQLVWSFWSTDKYFLPTRTWTPYDPAGGTDAILTMLPRLQKYKFGNRSKRNLTSAENLVPTPGFNTQTTAPHSGYGWFGKEENLIPIRITTCWSAGRLLVGGSEGCRSISRSVSGLTGWSLSWSGSQSVSQSFTWWVGWSAWRAFRCSVLQMVSRFVCCSVSWSASWWFARSVIYVAGQTVGWLIRWSV
jgi:hypothetical protein